MNALPDNPSSSALITSKMSPFFNEYLFLTDWQNLKDFLMFLRYVESFACIKDFF